MSLDTISQTFGLPVEIEEPKPPAVIIQDTFESDWSDKEHAKSTLRRLMGKSESTLDEMIEIAKSTEHPRAFEVAKQLIDSTANLAKQLAELAKADAPEMKQTTNIANAQTVVFAGTPAELLKQMRAQNDTPPAK